MQKLSFKAALSKGLADAMQEHPRSFMLGQDIAQFSILGISAGMHERFGTERIRNSPISESAMVGMAVGAAMKGYVGIIEMAYADISAVAFSSIVHSAAKLHYATNGQLPCPMLIRSPIGRWSRHGPMGTEITASWYCNVPDLALAMPATPHEAYWQTRAAFTRPVPTMILEERDLLGIEGDVGPDDGVERARELRAGRDLTIIGAGRAVKLALEAAEALDAEGRRGAVQVLSLGHIKPLDSATILAAARKTRRVLIVQDEPGFGGYGPMVQSALDALPPDALLRSPKLLARADTFLPHRLEEDHLPTTAQVVAEAKKLLQ